MIEVKRFTCNMLQENGYVVSDETREAVIIDCGAFYHEERQAVVEYIRSNRLVPKHLLCTHGHFDHVFGCDTIFREFSLKPEVSAADSFLMEDMAGQLMSMMGMTLDTSFPPVGHYFAPDEVIRFGSHQLQVLPTPGHTPGSVLFHCKEENVVFTGDTLFQMSIGRTDFERGSWDDMMHSLQTVVALLPAETKAYCGHGPETTIAQELRLNPYLRRS